jgi:hypothetical protein
MSRSHPKVRSGPTCWECGAANDLGAPECWLCGREDWHAPLRLPLPPEPEPPAPSDPGSGLVGLALALVALGACVIAPGLVFGLAILALPAWVGAEFLAHRRQNRGRSTSAARKLVWIAMLTALMPFLLSAALFIALWLFCLAVGPPSIH